MQCSAEVPMSMNVHCIVSLVRALKIVVIQAGNTPAELAKEKKIELWRFLDDVANGESTTR